jgi:hypothetical protein
MLKKLLWAISLTLIPLGFGFAGEINTQSFYLMNNIEINQLLQETSGRPLTITERINLYSERFLGIPYNLTCAGDGPYALLENWPLVNFKETNCMVFCEHVLALAISDSWDNFFNNLQQIRYQDGIIGMRTRNHYTMGDWLPENSWLLENVSHQVAAEKTVNVTRTISHRKFFEGKGLKDLRYVKPDREITIAYVPLEALASVEPKAEVGDILALIFAQKNDIFSAHMLLIAEKDGRKVIRESSNSRMSTFDTPYQEWVAAKQGSQRYCGLVFMRVRPELNTPSRIICPWEIKTIKAHYQTTD